jgi:Peroxiredoxin
MEFPDVELKAHTGETINPSRYEKVVVYFFPKAFTSGCTREAIRSTRFTTSSGAIGFEVLGVSVDGVETLRKFAEKYGLRFKLLSDEGGALARRLGILSLRAPPRG